MAISGRVVLDTNVLVSAVLLKRSVSRQAFDQAFSEGVVIASDATVLELNEVLRRDSFDRYVPASRRLQFIAELVRVVELVTIQSRIDDCRDPRDNMILELAVDGRATCVVSGDKDLLVLNPYRGIPIVTPSEYVVQPQGS
jgi:hypothetical protein